MCPMARFFTVRLPGGEFVAHIYTRASGTLPRLKAASSTPHKVHACRWSLTMARAVAQVNGGHVVQL